MGTNASCAKKINLLHYCELFYFNIPELLNKFKKISL